MAVWVNLNVKHHEIIHNCVYICTLYMSKIYSYGLSYTTFSISQPVISTPLLKLETPEWAAFPESHHHYAAYEEKRALVSRLETKVLGTVNITVANTGPREGDEVVFLFKNATEAVLTREHRHQDSSSLGSLAEIANKELIGFMRVSLGPGESQVV